MKRIEDYPNYFVTKDGKVWSEKSQKFLKPMYDKRHYSRIELSKGNNIGVAYSIHRLVATAYIPNPENKPQVNHIDGNKQNNFVENLEWVTNQENAKHAYSLGLFYISDKLKEVTRQRCCKRVLDTSTGIYYRSAVEVAKVFGINRGTLSGKLSGSRTNNTSFVFA